MTHLVQILLPLANEGGKRFEKDLYDKVTEELTERFGGLTAYAQAPARGCWEERPGKMTQDDIVVYEVMVEELETTWWSEYRAALERRFEQDEIVVRAQEMRRL